MLFLIYSLILVTTHSQSCSASLFITSFSPPTFNLTFSHATPLPKFQLLFNNINISYSIANDPTEESKYFQIQAELENINPQQYSIELYTLIFSEPLGIFNGQLQLNDYILEGEYQLTESEYLLQPFEETDNLYFYQNQNQALNIMAILMVTLTYLASLIDITGIWMMEFLQVFAFFQLHSRFFTYFDYKLSYYLLFEPHQIPSQTVTFIYLLAPFILIFISFFLGLVSRFFLKNLAVQSWKWKIVHRYLGYKFFIIVWRIMAFPIFANTFHLLRDPDHFNGTGAYFYVYFGFLTTVAFLYFGFMIVNPKCCQNQRQWEQYKKSRHFSYFEGFHKGLILDSWSRRNANMFIVIAKLVICFFLTMLNSLVPSLIVENFILLYLFTIRPYSFSFYTRTSIRMQILVVIFYFYLSLINLYFGISSHINTSTDVTICMIITIIICCLILILFGILSVMQLYEKVKGIKRMLEKENYKKKEEEMNRRKISKEEIFELRKKQRIKPIILEDQKIRNRNKSIIREKQKKQIQKESLLQNVAHKP